MKKKIFILITIIILSFLVILELFKYNKFKNCSKNIIILTEFLDSGYNSYFYTYYKTPTDYDELYSHVKDIRPEIHYIEDCILNINDNYIFTEKNNEIIYKINKNRIGNKVINKIENISFFNWIWGFELILYKRENLNLCNISQVEFKLFDAGRLIKADILLKKFKTDLRENNIVYRKYDDSIEKVIVYGKKRKNIFVLSLVCGKEKSYNAIKKNIEEFINNSDFSNSIDEFYIPVCIK